MDGETQAAVEGEVISPQIYADKRRSGIGFIADGITE
jgi:hypothetical protein